MFAINKNEKKSGVLLWIVLTFILLSSSFFTKVAYGEVHSQTTLDKESIIQGTIVNSNLEKAVPYNHPWPIIMKEESESKVARSTLLAASIVALGSGIGYMCFGKKNRK